MNVLVALAWPNHVHHAAAHEWFRDHRRRGWATCPVTESGFVRVSSNARVIPEARSPAEAILLLRRVVALPGHVFWPDDISLATSRFIAPARIVGHNQVTDAHLLALALRRRGCIATFDEGVRDLAAAAERDAVVLIPSAAPGE